jgi:hypothetical protein
VTLPGDAPGQHPSQPPRCSLRKFPREHTGRPPNGTTPANPSRRNPRRFPQGNISQENHPQIYCQENPRGTSLVPPVSPRGHPRTTTQEAIGYTTRDHHRGPAQGTPTVGNPREKLATHPRNTPGYNTR